MFMSLRLVVTDSFREQISLYRIVQDSQPHLKQLLVFLGNSDDTEETYVPVSSVFPYY